MCRFIGLLIIQVKQGFFVATVTILYSQELSLHYLRSLKKILPHISYSVL
jgi:hypothetical protein